VSEIIYIAGPITGIKGYQQKFARAERKLKKCKYIVFNPAFMPEGLEHSAYMPICYAMIDACDTVFFLEGWKYSAGCKMEYKHAKSKRQRHNV